MRLFAHATIACLAGLLAGPLARASAAPETAAVAGDAAIVVTAEGLDADALREALALRVPGVRPRVEPGDDLSCETGCTFAHVAREADERLRISVQLADGRLFVRTLPAPSAELERAAATSLAHLLAAIADGSARPDPPPILETATPGPAAPGCPEPPITHSPATTEPRASPPPARSPAPRFELGPTAGLATVFGVGPPHALAGWVGSGGLVGVELRHRSGLVTGLELRGLGARADGFRLARLRVAAVLGHSLRRGRFELRTRAGVHVEPWWVVSPADGPHRRSGPPLVGGALSLTPGLSLALAPDLRVDLGLRAEIAVSAHAVEGGAVQLVDSARAPVFRLGGVELGVAAELGVRWGLPRR